MDSYNLIFELSAIALIFSLFACVLVFFRNRDIRKSVICMFGVLFSSVTLVYASHHVFNSSVVFFIDISLIIIVFTVLMYYTWGRRTYSRSIYRIIPVAFFTAFMILISSYILKGGINYPSFSIDNLWRNDFDSFLIRVFILTVLIVVLCYLCSLLLDKFSHRSSYSINNETMHKLFDLYQTIKSNTRGKGTYYRRMLPYFVNGLDVPEQLKDSISRKMLRDVQEEKDYTFTEFKRQINLINTPTEQKLSLDNSYLLEEIVGRTKIVMRDELDRLIYAERGVANELTGIKEVLVPIIKQYSLSTQTIEEDNPYSQYIKELFHSLMTPISQIEISADIIKERTDVAESDRVILESVEAISKGVKLLYSFLYAYRQIAFAGYSSNSEDILTINEGIDSARIVYEKKFTKKVSFKKSNIPDGIKGLSNNFILAVLLPLLENAMYAVHEGEEIVIKYNNDENNLQDHVFIVQNPVHNPINVDDLYIDGFSSKQDNGTPHEGLGLKTVRTLISKKEGSFLKFKLIDNESTLETCLTIHL